MTAPGFLTSLAPVVSSERPAQAELHAQHPLRERSTADLSHARDLVVRAEAHRVGVPVPLALAVSRVENTRGLPWAVSNAGAVGVMQVMPGVHGGTSQELADLHIGARRGLEILRSYYDQHGSWMKALRAYNGTLRHEVAGDRYVNKVRQELHSMAGLPPAEPINSAQARFLDALALARHAIDEPRFTDTERKRLFAAVDSARVQMDKEATNAPSPR